MRERHFVQSLNCIPEFFYWQRRAGLENLIFKGDCRAHFPYLWLTSELWLRPWVWFNF